MDVERILRNTPATLSITYYGEETPADADGTVNITIKRRSDGTTIVNNAVAPHVGAAGTGQYKYDLAPRSTVDSLVASWTGTFGGVVSTITTYIEIVGGFYFTLAELRASDSALADTTKYPTTTLEKIRQAVEIEFEQICHRAFVPRFAYERLAGDGTTEILLGHPEPTNILSLRIGTYLTGTVDYASHIPYIVSDGHRIIELEDGYAWPQSDVSNVVIEYEYGRPYCPGDVKDAALKRAKNRLVSKNARIDERATSMNVPDFGTFTLATPGRDGSYTGIPDVDVVLDRWALMQTGGIW